MSNQKLTFQHEWDYFIRSIDHADRLQEECDEKHKIAMTMKDETGRSTAANCTAMLQALELGVQSDLVVIRAMGRFSNELNTINGAVGMQWEFNDDKPKCTLDFGDRVEVYDETTMGGDDGSD